MSSSDDPLERAEQLLERLEAERARLEQATDPEVVIDVLGQLAELAREIEAELNRAQREAGAGA
jgi:hypothetical protein